MCRDAASQTAGFMMTLQTEILSSYKRRLKEAMSFMPTGVVKWFNSAKGYGFISGADNAEDIFAHFSAIEMEGYRTLKRGQPVEFELTVGPKGLHATQIRLTNEQSKLSN